MKKLVLALVMSLMIVGCSQNKETPDLSLTMDDFMFEGYKPNDQFTGSELGDNYQYSESESCGFTGLDKFYSYDYYDIGTYPNGDVDHILYIDLYENQQTARGISIGNTKDDVINAYGEDYTQEGDYYVYTMDKMLLKFLIINDAVGGIQMTYDA